MPYFRDSPGTGIPICQVRNIFVAKPKISVVMSVYNGSSYLPEAVESILKQTYSHFEFIIIDDGSVDNTWEILLDYATQDQRIALYRNEKNIGLTKSLNKGLRLAKGDYIARQDADDISLPARLEEQLTYMASHETVAMACAGVQIISGSGKVLKTYTPPQNPAVLRWQLLYRNPIRHATVIWRRQPIERYVGLYDPNFRFAQDYDLWVRIANRFPIGVLPLVLVKYRTHAESIYMTEAEHQDALAAQVTHRQIRRFFQSDQLTDNAIVTLRAVLRQRFVPQYQRLNDIDVVKFKQTSKHFLSLFQEFRADSKSDNTVLRLHELHLEIESHLSDLIRHCRRQGWHKLGLEILWSYLRHYPSRSMSVISRLMYRMVKKTKTNVRSG